jgi:hydroxypyruvate isomerase
MMIEPLNATDKPEYFLQTTTMAVEIIQQVNHPHLRLQYDVVHAQMQEGNLINTIRRCFDLIGHIQIADVPGRHQPGTGEIHYPAVFAALEELGYDGFIGLEYKPDGNTDKALDWLPRQARSVSQ